MSAGEHLSVSALAAARGISKQAVSKRLERLRGRINVKRHGRELLVPVAEFDRLVAEETDPSQELRNRSTGRSKLTPDVEIPFVASEPAPQPKPNQDLALNVYAVQRAKRETSEAEMSRLRVERESGRWVDAAKAEMAWGKALSAFIAETESFMVNRLARDMAEEQGLDFKVLAVSFRDKFRAFRQQEADHLKLESESKNGVHD